MPQFGISTHRGRNPDDVNLRLASDIHARVVRFDLPWVEIERDGRYDFSSYDDLIGKLRASGKSVILLLAYGHPGHSDGRAENGFPLPPRTAEQRAAYGRYIEAVARRYHGDDIVYQIWNEPNLALFWPPATNAKAYGELLADASQVIRKIQPAATIIPAGLANENKPADFLNTLASAGALEAVDGIAFHPYRQDGPENSLFDMHEFESSAGRNKPPPLWITEWGYNEKWFARSFPGDPPDRRLAVMTARLMLTAAIAKAKTVIVYDLIDDERDATFGLHDYDFKPKQAAAAFRTLSTLMSTCATYQFSFNPIYQVITAVFRTDSTTTHVAWTYDTVKDHDVCIDVGVSDVTGLHDILGRPVAAEACSRGSGPRLKLSEAAGPVVVVSRTR